MTRFTEGVQIDPGKLRVALLKRGLNPSRMGRQLGMSPSTIARLTRGESVSDLTKERVFKFLSDVPELPVVSDLIDELRQPA